MDKNRGKYSDRYKEFRLALSYSDITKMKAEEEMLTVISSWRTSR